MSEKIEPVAWMLVRKADGFIRATYSSKPCQEQMDIAEMDGDEYLPLVHATTVSALEARVRELEEALVACNALSAERLMKILEIQS